MLTIGSHKPALVSHGVTPPKMSPHTDRSLGINTTGGGHQQPWFDKTPFLEAAQTLRAPHGSTGHFKTAHLTEVTDGYQNLQSLSQLLCSKIVHNN